MTTTETILPKLYTVARAAELIPRALRTVYDHAHALGLGYSVDGSPDSLLLTAEDIERLRAYRPRLGRKPKGQ